MIGTNVFGEKVVLLPLVDKDKIKKIVYEFDGEFISSVVARSDFIQVLNRIVDNAFVITAFFENEIIGFCAFYINDFKCKTVYVSLIAVKKKYQGMHVGTIMMEYVKAMSRLNDFDRIRLEVDDANKNAIVFYKRNSFIYEKDASAVSKYMVCDL